jgi:hypothetical protein
MAYNFAQPVQLAVDNFQRVDEFPLSQGGNWILPTGSADFRIVSHAVECQATGLLCVEYYSGGLAWTADQYSEVIVGPLVDANQFFGPIVRSSGNAVVGLTQYRAVAEGPLGSQCTLFVGKLVAGIETDVAILHVPLAIGDKLRVNVVGTSVSAYINGILVPGSTFTDTAISGVGSLPGITGLATTLIADAQISGWSGGNMVSPAIVVPEVGPGTISSRSPLITPGWPLASVPAANPIAAGPNSPAQTSDPSDAGQVARQTRALAQANETNSRLI